MAKIMYPNMYLTTDGKNLKYNSRENEDSPWGEEKTVGEGSAQVVELTRAEYDALPESKYTDGVMYCITDANNIPLNATASDIKFDNTDTGLQTTNVQEALVECFQSVSDGKALVASAITDKGVETASDATFETMATNIAAIVGGEVSGGSAPIISTGASACNKQGLGSYTGTETITVEAGEHYLLICTGTTRDGMYCISQTTLTGENAEIELVSSEVQFGVNAGLTYFGSLSYFLYKVKVTEDTDLSLMLKCNYTCYIPYMVFRYTKGSEGPSNEYIRYNKESGYIEAIDNNGNWCKIYKTDSLPILAEINMFNYSWSASNGTLSVTDTLLKYIAPSISTDTQTAITDESIIIRNGGTLSLEGTLVFSTESSTTSGYKAYMYLEITTDDGSSWTSLFDTLVKCDYNGTSGTISFNESIDLSAYEDHNCKFRIRAYHTRDNSGYWSNATVSLTKFNISY